MTERMHLDKSITDQMPIYTSILDGPNQRLNNDPTGFPHNLSNSLATRHPYPPVTISQKLCKSRYNFMTGYKCQIRKCCASCTSN